MYIEHIRSKIKEEAISPAIFVYYFIYSGPNLTRTQILTLKLTPNLYFQLIAGIGEGARGLGPPIEILPMIKMSQKSLVFSVSVSFSILAYNGARVQQ